jgi:hypothetical protein
MKRTKLTPEMGSRYRLINGGEYRPVFATNADPLNRHETYLREDGHWMQNVKTGWTCFCVGLGQYADGSIDWDYSLYGYFA